MPQPLCSFTDFSVSRPFWKTPLALVMQWVLTFLVSFYLSEWSLCSATGSSPPKYEGFLKTLCCGLFLLKPPPPKSLLSNILMLSATPHQMSLALASWNQLKPSTAVSLPSKSKHRLPWSLHQHEDPLPSSGHLSSRTFNIRFDSSFAPSLQTCCLSAWQSFPPSPVITVTFTLL